jgi:signal transduction histidine kinase
VRPTHDRLLLLAASAAALGWGALVVTSPSAAALVWGSAGIAVLGLVAVLPGGRRSGDTAAAVTLACAAPGAAVTAGLLLSDGAVDPWRLSAGGAVVVEALALSGLIVVSMRTAPLPRGLAAAAVAGLVVATANFRFEGSATSVARVVGTLTWAVVGAAAAGAGVYLRGHDERRARALVDAKRDQRLLLARDLHDYVAHDVSAALAQAQAGQILAGDSPQVAGTFARIEDSAQRALRSMDRTLRMLHDLEAEDPQQAGRHLAPPGLADLPELVARFASTGSWQVELHTPPDLDGAGPESLPAEVSTTLYRVAVEALTNVRRHAPGAGRVDVHLALGPTGSTTSALVLTITDDAPAGPGRPARRRSGLGLPALAGRVEALGGTFSAGPAGDRGWTVRAGVPLDGTEARA